MEGAVERAVAHVRARVDAVGARHAKAEEEGLVLLEVAVEKPLVVLEDVDAHRLTVVGAVKLGGEDGESTGGGRRSAEGMLRARCAGDGDLTLTTKMASIAITIDLPSPVFICMMTARKRSLHSAPLRRLS